LFFEETKNNPSHFAENSPSFAENSPSFNELSAFKMFGESSPISAKVRRKFAEFAELSPRSHVYPYPFFVGNRRGGSENEF
jgi:hypothetical protein